MNLPQDYLEEMQEILGDEFEEFLAATNDKSKYGLRVNTNKISVEDFVKIAPYDIELIPFVNDGFYISENDNWSKHPYYYAGLYYLQEPSAMLPANRLPIDVDDIVLDLCAAPGGKSTKLVNRARAVLSNDISYSRTIPLVKNLEINGTYNYCVTSEDPNRLSERFEEYFDKIIVDAPCSGEGMFRKDSNLVKSWIKKRPNEYVDIQRDILNAAYKMLKPGGMIMYSTCTFSKLEDEENVINLLQTHADLNLCDIESYDGFSYGYKEYINVYPEINKCIHIFPHKVNGEGHFMALFKKSDECKENHETDAKTKRKNYYEKLLGYENLDCQIKDFFSCYDKDTQGVIAKSQFVIMEDGMIFMITEDVKRLMAKGVRYVRTGLHIGTMGKNKRFVPSTALALAFEKEAFINRIDFGPDDANVIKYLKGETIVFEELMETLNKGYFQICVSGFPLGFAKYDGVRLKNMYEKGWRMT